LTVQELTKMVKDELQATVQELTKMVKSMKQNDHGKELTQLLRAHAAENATKRSTRGTTAMKRSTRGTTATHEDVGLDDTNSGGENRTKPLKAKAVKLQLFRAPPGSRVKIETKKFDDPKDEVPFSVGKPKWSSGTVVKVNELNKIVTVLWDGDEEGVDEVDSSYKHLQWLDDEEQAKAVLVANTTTAKLKSLTATMLENEVVTDAKAFYNGLVLIDCNSDVEAARKLEPHRTLARLANQTDLSSDEHEDTDDVAEGPDEE
jgi:hypothetical protein